ncbi:S-layer homology domain-containing protein [Paenibacillus dokdonensis]|uniref:S-layer homology domain-containing protein n=1 Tax=Paenibacillus dokdonensis TaxID=2567944 RepID=A0ABU6GQ66_9BACL|nr:S-layer homology domain-containing protein [Paenibacillus dokdonensis]MEC0241894.1 S-layer homology domain-containing protein [Paenibacillus dokdonensis]
MLKKFAAILGFVMILGWLASGTSALAADADPFISLKSTSSGSEVKIVVTGEHLKDLYAYDFMLTYDAQKLAYQSASAGASGFSIDPIVNNSDIRIAHTKVGKIAGDNGTLELAVVKFKRLQTGAAELSIHDVKLVDSKLNTAGTNVKAAFTVGKGSTSTEVTLEDIKGHWAQDAIIQAVQQGWITGYSNGIFLPNKEVTRAEFAAMLIRAMGTDGGTHQPLQFTDAKQIPTWALAYVEEAVSRSIMNGYENGAFGPNKLITRAEMAAMAIRSLHVAEVAKDSSKLSFADSSLIPAWAKPYAAEAAQKGIMNGRSGNLFAPSAHATRAEAVVVILALLQQK